MAYVSTGPILELCRERLIPNPHFGVVTQDQIADECGVTLRTVARWVGEGTRTRFGDEIALKLGYHPSELFPEYRDLNKRW